MKASMAMDAALGDALRELDRQRQRESERNGRPAGIDAITPIGGGSISRTLLVESGQRRCFVKLHDAGLLDMFVAEADGLQSAGGLPGAARAARRRPRPSPASRPIWSSNTCACTACEKPRRRWRRQAARWPNCTASVARSSAGSATTSSAARRRSTPGMQTGRRSLPSGGCGHSSTWPNWGHHGRLIADGERLAETLGVLFVDHQPPASLLHGDLWSGNAAIDESGTVWRSSTRPSISATANATWR
jgi:protein-ribulosamine 3-kinase